MFINTPLGKVYLWTYHYLIEGIYQAERAEDYDNAQRLSEKQLLERVVFLAEDNSLDPPKHILDAIIHMAFEHFFLQGEETADFYLGKNYVLWKPDDNIVGYKYRLIWYPDFKKTFVYSDDFE